MTFLKSELNDPQGVGPNYSAADFWAAQKAGWLILFDLKNKIEEGMSEDDAREIYKFLLAEYGVEKNWHPPKIRFGPNTIKSFRESSNEYRLKKNDLFFLDLGPIVNGYEADIGKTFRLGTDEPTSVITDGEFIFNETRNKFLVEGLTGPELYRFAEGEASRRGWLLTGEGANGHRIGDFPHQVFYKGNLRNFPEKLLPGVWILEIQLKSKDLTFGSFYEDVL